MIIKKFALSLFIIVLLPSCSERPVAYKLEDNAAQVLFSPDDACADKIVSQINGAKDNIVIAMYSFTSRPIAQSLVEAAKRGVDIRVCIDGTDPDYRYSKDKYLEEKDIPVKLIKGKGLMHNKFCVIDDEIIITGSFNWTARADRENDENLLIIRSQEIAKEYKTKFEELWRR